MEIRNGNTEGDWKGEATYVGCNAGSVIDLLLERREGKPSVVKEIRVEERIESDHLPVSFII